MKIIATSDWHLGNLFHGNDRLPEHRHFLQWLLNQIEEQKPDALLVAGDVFDNGNPSAASQSTYYEFLANVTQKCPNIQIVITAGNHDSASRLEAPRPLLSRYKVDIRGSIHRTWEHTPEGDKWLNDYDDLIIPIKNSDGDEVIVLAVPYLRSDVVQNASYSQGVNNFLRELTQRARELYPDRPLIMMAHMYAKGATIASKDASEKIVIGGQEEVNMEGWSDHPDYLTCGHIHKRQHIWNTNWARYTGSVLPMSFAEISYKHGVDMITLNDSKQISVEFLEYTPQHQLRILPETDEDLTPKKLEKLIDAKLRARGENGKLSNSFDYVLLKVKIERVNNDTIKELEDYVNAKDAVLCKIQRIMPTIDLQTIIGNQNIVTIDDILDRDPIETLKEAYLFKNKAEMSESQIKMLQNLIASVTNETND
jgi:exonuclease SbcD